MGQAIQTLTPKIHKIITWVQKQNRTTTIVLNLVTFGLLWFGYSTVRRITADSTKIAAVNQALANAGLPIAVYCNQGYSGVVISQSGNGSTS